jgi:hypothetical protein
LLPADDRSRLRESFRGYVDSRLETYRKLPDLDAAKAELAKSIVLQTEIWTDAVAAARSESSPATMLLLPALNAMFDITTTRTLAAQMHPPAVVHLMLIALALTSALLAGYGMGRAEEHDWLHLLGFAAATAVTVYVILDMEYPRVGFIRVDAFDNAIVELRDGMK